MKRSQYNLNVFLNLLQQTSLIFLFILCVVNLERKGIDVIVLFIIYVNVQCSRKYESAKGKK